VAYRNLIMLMMAATVPTEVFVQHLIPRIAKNTRSSHPRNRPLPHNLSANIRSH